MAVRDIALPASYALGLDSLSALRRRLDNDPARALADAGVAGPVVAEGPARRF